MKTIVEAAKPAIHTQPYAWASFVIFLTDLASLQLCLWAGFLIRALLSAWFTAEIGFSQAFGVAVGILVLPLVNYHLGLYPGFLLGPVERLRRRTLATLAVFGGLVAWDSLVARGALSRGILLATFAGALFIPPLAESLVRKLLVRVERWGIPVIILGCGETGRTLAASLLREPDLGLKPVAFLDNRSATWGAVIEGIPVLGPLRLAPEFEHRVDAAIVSLSDLGQEDAAVLLNDLNFPRVIVVPDLRGIASLWVSARSLGACLGLEIKKNLLIRRNTLLKEWMDRAIALPLFLASLPVIAVAGMWIKLASRGPVFYRQMREGLDGRRISVWKLRTMYSDGHSILETWFELHPEDRAYWSRHFKLRHDPRVLPLIGTFLRRTSLDELPQLWSILKGEMSLVGPRPFPDYHLEQFPSEFRALRTRVLPGLTGLWQVTARSDGDVKVQEALDTYYIRNWSPWLDLYILARTVSAVLLARGAY